ncbi:MAG: PQQ-binding-like beta-propeller repeat protein [Phycisphaera sp.]|nr:PQQ-binding-like beta-propeller repeat protein [Phycisphaera sp.]
MNTQTRSPRWLVSLCPCLIAIAVCLAPSLNATARAATPDETAKQILADTGVRGGFVVHVGCGDGKLTAALRVNDSYQVQGLDRDAKNVDAARRYVHSLGVYGDVCIDRMTTDTLPYADNLVNLLVVEDDSIKLADIERVLTPLGAAYVKKNGAWKKITKAWPKEIDEWTHYLHDPSNNAVAHDTKVGPPRHLQWQGNPSWSRHHDRMASMSALVTAKGRMFYVMDEGSRVTIETPSHWVLTARDAFNGTILWKRDIPDWHEHMWPLKSGPTQLTRRLVAVGDRVFITLGIDAPLTCLDAATGKTVQTYDRTTATEEIIVEGDTAFALVRDGKWELEDYLPQQATVGDQGIVGKTEHWNAKPRHIVALDVESGLIRWQHDSKVAPLTLAADADRVYFHDGESKVVCLDRKTGEVAWSQEGSTKDAYTFNFGPKVVLHGDVVLFAGGDRKMHGYDAATGKELWSAPHERGGYQSPEDLLVIDGKVWSAATTSGKDNGEWTGRDVKTGEVKVQFPPNVDTYWFHHRCYIAKATDNYLMPSRTGIEFVDFRKEDWQIHHWVRGGCLYGVLPANGFTYAPPHDCACFPEAKLYGFNALLADSEDSCRHYDPDKVDGNRVEKGPAFDSLADQPEASHDGDWPTFRGDFARSGHSPDPVPANLKASWRAQLGGRLSAPVVAGGRVYISQIDAHTVHALDADTGKPIWAFTAGGRVDSPPTVYKGTLLFGSADGWVYCVRASDGVLAWRFRAAPKDLRIMAMEQVESIWPVHGSILIKDDAAYFVAGRSVFLDGGITMFKLDPTDGEILSRQQMDDKDPATGKNLQTLTQTLQGPAGLADVLSCDGNFIYMRSQKFDFEGKREGIGPVSGDPAKQGADQRGEGVHLYAPMGYLDDSYFHRAYWIYGKNFAGGHSGYFQAGKNAPAGRILVNDGTNIYGYGRKPEYLKWTTVLEHQLFAAPKDQPEIAPITQADRRGSAYGNPTDSPTIQFTNNPGVDPTRKPLSVEAWIKADKQDGVVVSRGGPRSGYALVIIKGVPRFVVRIDENIVVTAEAREKIGKQWAHLAGVLTADRKLQIYVDGQLAGSDEVPELINTEPKQAMEIGSDDGGTVGTDYQSPFTFNGLIDEVRVYEGALTAEDVTRHYSGGPADASTAKLLVNCTFDDGKATDSSGNKNDGKVSGAEPQPGKVGQAMRFGDAPQPGAKPAPKPKAKAANAKAKGKAQPKYNVTHSWNQDVPLYATAMTVAADTLLVAGPEDSVNESEAFARYREQEIKDKLAQLDAALRGEHGAKLLSVDTATGKTRGEFKLDTLPVWDGMAAAHGKVYVALKDGSIVCLTGNE